MAQFTTKIGVSKKPKSVRLTEDQLAHASKRIERDNYADLSDYIRSLIDADMGVSPREIVVSAYTLEKIAKKVDRLESLLENGVAVKKSRQKEEKPKSGTVTATKGALAHKLRLLRDDEDED